MTEEKQTTIEEALKMTKRIYTINELKKLIYSLYKDEKDIVRIYLFGSYARGEATKESDIDLYIICDKNIIFKTFQDRSNLRIYYREKINIYKPIDLFLLNETEFEEAKEDIYQIENEVSKEGIILYEQR